MNYMFEVGFLGTRAPFFMDLVTIIVALLPLLMVSIITLAVKKKYKAHAFAQIALFITSIIVFTYFEIGVRMGGGFNYFIDGSTVSHSYALIVLILHIIIATVTLFIWAFTIFKAKKHLENNTHKINGRRTLIGVILISVSGIWVYLLLFVY